MAKDKTNADGRMVVALKHPVQFGSEKITRLEFKRPKARHFRGLPLEPKVGDIMDLMARLADVPPSVIDELEPEDLEAASSIVGGFMPGGRATGSTRSR